MDDEDFWTIRQVAEYLEIAESSVSAYVSTGEMPAPDKRYGRTPLWRPETIKTWQASRPRRGGQSHD